MDHAWAAQLAARGATPEELAGALEARLAAVPRCPAANYLLGCLSFDQGRPAIAVRHMMVAHRVEPDLQSAALLVFAGLNLAKRRGAQFLQVLLETWEEFRRPEFDRYARERQLLSAWVEPPPAFGSDSALARRLWRLPIRLLRAQIRAAVESHDARLYPLLAAPI